VGLLKKCLLEPERLEAAAKLPAQFAKGKLPS